jgi:succinate-semialdehyde dehydrogenase/glutarate-semialdehyde dehydrogenase
MERPPSPQADLPVYHSWIAGREIEGRAGWRTVVDPSDGSPFARASLLDARQVGDALERAREASPAWARTDVRERSRALQRLRGAVVDEADEIARLVQREQGKPTAEAHAAEVLPALETLKHLARHAEELLREDTPESQQVLLAHKDARVVLEPWGVVLVITPWNYPFGLPLPLVAAALVAGNSVVLKPAPSTTLTALRIGALARRAGLPEGVLSVLAVDDELAPVLVEDPRVGKIVFTGSVETGKKVMAAAARNLTPVLLELGGKDPAIVCGDADLDRAVPGIVWGAFMNTGQTCASIERVYVARELAEAFVSRVVEETLALRIGGERPTDVGPLTLRRQREIVERHVADARARGARVLTGGETPPGPGHYYPPTVLADVDHTMTVMREETFGPVLPIMAVESLDEAIRLANETEYGLTASGWTRSRETARRLQRELQAGVVTINDGLSSFGEPTAPWGGVKHSGIGRTHGRLGLREMVRPKYVTDDRSEGPELWWYPYDDAYERLLSEANRALHTPSPWRRVSSLLRLASHGRVWQRLGPRRLLMNIDKLF